MTRLHSITAAGAATSARALILFAAFVSFALSVILWFGGHHDQGIFVGLWVPSILALGAVVLPQAITMSGSGLYIIGVLVTFVVVGALAILFYAEVLDGREATLRAQATNLLDAARESGRFTTWLDAVGRAGLEPTLTGPGPITVFAPTDEAFAKLPAGAVESLLAEPTMLESVLTYHLVEGRVSAADVRAMRAAPTLNGETLPVSVDGSVHVHDATVLHADIPASNGVIHVIDRVLLPAAI